MSMGLGVQMQMADPNTPTDPQHWSFCEDAIDSLNIIPLMMYSPFELMSNKMGITTQMAKTLAASSSRADAHSQGLIAAFVARRERGELTESEQNSYLASLLQMEGAELVPGPSPANGGGDA
jgi:hypothetical protein